LFQACGIRATLTPLVALMGVWVLRTRPKSGGLAKIQRQRLMVLVSLAAMCGLVQYPFAAPIYLLYACTDLAGRGGDCVTRRGSGDLRSRRRCRILSLFGVVMLFQTMFMN